MIKYKFWFNFLIILDFFKNHNIIIFNGYFLNSWINDVFNYGYMIAIGYIIIYFYLTDLINFKKKKNDSLTDFWKFSVNDEKVVYDMQFLKQLLYISIVVMRLIFWLF